MKPEQLDRRLTLLRADVVQDDTGQEIQDWDHPALNVVVWASKRDVSDGERIAAAEVAASITTRFQIRWASAWSDLNPKDRVICEGRTYDVQAVKEIGRREGLEITAAARTD